MTEDKALKKVSGAMLIKSVRLGMRDGITAIQNTGAYPDDTVIEMQKGLSRITADYARFLNTKPMTVRKASAPGARKLHKEHGLEPIFEEMASRLEDVEDREWRWTRAYEDPSTAAQTLLTIYSMIKRPEDLDDDECEKLEKLLNPNDLNPRDEY